MNLTSIINQCAEKHGLDPLLVAGVIIQESEGYHDIARLEQGFYRRYIEPMELPVTEEILRSASYGQMQIMGQTAREFGFKGSFDDLCKPEINIDLGCKILAKFISDKGGVRRGLLRYNGGGDSQYPDKVYGHINSKRINLIYIPE